MFLLARNYLNFFPINLKVLIEQLEKYHLYLYFLWKLNLIYWKLNVSYVR